MMQYSTIFPNSTKFPIPLYPILALLFSTGLFYAITTFITQKIIQKLLNLTQTFHHVYRTIIYLFLMNFPIIFLAIISFINNHSLLGFQASFDIDIMQTMVLGGYICYIEQSRQTPICGFLFIRDLICVIGAMVAFGIFYFDGKISVEYGLVLVAFYFVYLILLKIEESMEESVLRLLKLKGNDVYNAAYLMTQEKKQSNFLEIKELLEDNKDLVQQELQQFQRITSNVIKSLDQQLILQNFAKLFLPFKKFHELQEQELLQSHLKTIQEDWKDEHDDEEDDEGKELEEGQQQQQQEEDEDEVIGMDDEKLSNNQSDSDIGIRKKCTFASDYIVQSQQPNQSQGKFYNILKCMFYPVYAFSRCEGRVRYFLDYFCVALLCASMWMISNSFAYFSSATNGTCLQLFSAILMLILIVPSARYHIKMSSTSDFDFINIFLQSSILKCVIFGTTISISSFAGMDFQVDYSLGLAISFVLAMVTYLIFGIFMIAQKFATLKKNLRFFVILVVITFVLRILTEIIVNIMQRQHQKAKQ